MPQLNFRGGLQTNQYQSINNLLNSGRQFNETDARNLAYATNQNNWQQFVGQSGSGFTIGNLSQYLPNATPNVNPNNLSENTLPNLGQSSVGSYFQNVVTSGMSQTEMGINRLFTDRENQRATKEKEAQSRYDKAYAGLETAYQAESGEALMRRLMGEQGIQEKMDKLTEFQNQLVALQGSYQTAVNDIGNKPINSAIIRGQQYLKEQEFAGKASVIQAQSAIVQNQFNMAKDIVSSYYEAASNDRQNQINRYQTLLGLAKDELVDLDAEEKDNINAIIGNLQAMDARQREEKDKIADLMLDPIAQIAFQNTPGLDLNMSYADMIEKLLPEMAAENTRRYNLENTPRGGSGGGSSTATTQFEKDIADLASQVISMENAGASSPEQYWQLVNQYAQEYGYQPASIDKMLIAQIRQKKGEPAINPTSDFVSSPTNNTVTTQNTISGNSFLSRASADTNRQLTDYKSRADKLRKIASGLTGASATEIRKAKNELATIPHTLNGKKIW